jgi:D-3-phosphoglycerate dehydrogenase
MPSLVVIVDCDFAGFELERAELEGLAELEVFQCRTESEVIEAAREADGILVQYAPISRAVIDSLRRCRVIARYGIGVDMIDLEAAARRGIWVVNVPDYCVEEVSDHAVALMLSSLRRLPRLDAAVRRGLWDASLAGPVLRVRDCTVGLVGLGKTARRVAAKLSGFGCRLLAHDPYPDLQAVGGLGVELVGLDELLASSDLVSLHAPLTPATRHLIDEHRLRRMKATAFLVNTSRGTLIDEKALCLALQQGWIAGAALDVAEREPRTLDDPLLGFDSVLFTPHAAFYSADSTKELQRRTARGVAEVLRGERPLHAVNQPRAVGGKGTAS